MKPVRTNTEVIPSQNQDTRVCVFDYQDFRVFLRDFYRQKKTGNPHFSFRYFSRSAGFRSPNFLKLVIEGKRNISPDSIEKFIKALKLNSSEASFFRSLVGFGQAGSSDEKQFYLEQIFKSKSFRKVRPLGETEYRYYKRWYYIAIRELIESKDFREDPHWIAQNLIPVISAQDAKMALDELLELGLLKRNSQGQLIRADEFITTGNEISSAFVSSFHREMLSRASEAMDRIPRKHRDISSVTIGLSLEDIANIKTLIQQFRKNLLAIASHSKAQACVYQVNFQFFPLSKIPEDSGPKGDDTDGESAA